jgi:hypothetical protein
MRIQHLLVVAMGKLGGGELNVSSDVDLIFVYPEDGETNGAKPISNHEFFARLGRKLIASLNDYTVDGYVFRVDMRLRSPWRKQSFGDQFSYAGRVFHQTRAGMGTVCLDQRPGNCSVTRITKLHRPLRRKLSGRLYFANIWTSALTNRCVVYMRNCARKSSAAKCTTTSNWAPGEFGK